MYCKDQKCTLITSVGKIICRSSLSFFSSGWQTNAFALHLKKIQLPCVTDFVFRVNFGRDVMVRSMLRLGIVSPSLPFPDLLNMKKIIRQSVQPHCAKCSSEVRIISLFYLAGCLLSLITVVNNIACFPTVTEHAVNPLCLNTVAVLRAELWMVWPCYPVFTSSDHLILLSCRKFS